MNETPDDLHRNPLRTRPRYSFSSLEGQYHAVGRDENRPHPVYLAQVPQLRDLATSGNGHDHPGRGIDFSVAKKLLLL